MQSLDTTDVSAEAKSESSDYFKFGDGRLLSP